MRLGRRIEARRGLTASSRGRASVGLGVVLLLVCSVALLGSHQLHSAIDRAQSASTSSDLYQDARYFAAQEDAELTTYRIDHDSNARVAHHDAAKSLDVTLKLISKSTAVGSVEKASADRILSLHERYQTLIGRVFHLLDTNRTSQATALENTRVTPILDSLTRNLSAFEEAHHVVVVAELNAAHRDGALLQVGTPLLLGLILLLLCVFILITRDYRRMVERQALHDALTGLPNRLLFADRVGHALAAAGRTAAQPVVMLLDLDHFKDVNDTLGHHYGDQLLIELAARLQSSLRPVDTVARLGGDEFAVLLPDGGAPAGTLAAKRILASLERPFTLAGITVGVEASIGIASADSPGIEPTTADASADAEMPDLLQLADTAMYQAKKDRDGYRHFVPRQAESTTEHLTLLGELRQALDRDELVVHYQPKIAVDTGELLGVEALVRWQHPTRGLLAPGAFIDLAEGTTLIHRLTDIVLGKALALTRGWLDQNLRLPVAVNVSARSLLGNGFPANVAGRLAEARVPASMLCLELTESTIMSDPVGALAILHQLHDSGIRLSVDDFGTGYSSMAYLKVLPVDELKVDRSFVKDMTSNHSDLVLVQSAVDLGHNLGLSVVAEGVEDQDTLAALQAIGADVVQGYYLGRPMSAELLKPWIAERAAQLGSVALPAEHRETVTPLGLPHQQVGCNPDASARAACGSAMPSTIHCELMMRTASRAMSSRKDRSAAVATIRSHIASTPTSSPVPATATASSARVSCSGRPGTSTRPSVNSSSVVPDSSRCSACPCSIVIGAPITTDAPLVSVLTSPSGVRMSGGRCPALAYRMSRLPSGATGSSTA
jgi:diguanylate cyclase (GGDEF)-like protein